MYRNYAFVLACLLCIVTGMLVPQPSRASSGVSDARYSRLTRGINMRWMVDVPYIPAYSRYGAADIDLIKNTGFRHIRFPVSIKNIWNDQNPQQLNRSGLASLDAILELILSRDLAVIVVPCDTDVRLWDDPAYGELYGKFWAMFARHLSVRDPERVFLEIANEPLAHDARNWNKIQPKVLAAMRAGAPNHTLIANVNERVSTYNFDKMAALEMLAVVEDPNVVYNFHFYTTQDFTFQGAKWGIEVWKHLHHLPYPSSLEACAPILPQIADPEARRVALDYCNQNWNITKLNSYLSRAAAWAQAKNVRLTANEFGVHKLASHPDDRSRWISDTRLLLESYSIGWAMWSYEDDFDVVNIIGGKRVVDPVIARALDLPGFGTESRMLYKFHLLQVSRYNLSLSW